VADDGRTFQKKEIVDLVDYTSLVLRRGEL